MDQVLQWFFAPGIMITLVLSVIFSFKGRREKNQNLRGLHTSRMNISMGVMLIFIAGVQLLLSAESTLRIIIGAVFLLLGVYNLFAGLRNHSIFRKRLDHEKTSA